MAKYKSGNTILFMNSGHDREWVTIYVTSFDKIKVGKFSKDKVTEVGLRLTRKMAFALIKEIEARLFDGEEKDIRISKTIEEKDTDLCFNI